MASARFPLVREEVVKAERKISRASSSIERPWWAARTRKRVLVFWSSFRMVSAAMSAMIALVASDAKRLISAPICRSVLPFRVPQHLPLLWREMTVPPMLDFPLARKRRHFVQRAHGVQHFAPRCGRGRLRRARTKRRRPGHGHAIFARRTVGIRPRRPGIPRRGRRRRLVPVRESLRRAQRRRIPVPVAPVWIISIRVARRRIDGRKDVVRNAVGIIAGRVI